ncbi:LuxR C-terminal-related transcriptional regulator [Pantoea sp. 1.19]|uniref:helix-turn-helix transcriptional regulator n=1 Tax=Pantoea sp. 1.19 TaxID=1925589 RepID=UPI000948B678|nr:LuxR C-terminal-related transcriptional regulator [Pantoea sp. 1.19]
MEARRIVIYLQDEDRFYREGLMDFLTHFFNQRGIFTQFTHDVGGKNIGLSFIAHRAAASHGSVLTTLRRLGPVFILQNAPGARAAASTLLRTLPLAELQRRLLDVIPHCRLTSLAPPPDAEESHAPLTLREIETLRYLARGLNNAAVARCLRISEKTVSSHKRNIMAKLSIGRRPDFNYWLLKQRDFFH